MRLCCFCLILASIVCTAWGAKPTICLDPGHPSEVGRGTQGKKLTEIQVAWDVAKELGAELKKLGYRVIFTKNSRDEFVTNIKRAEIANEAKADLMLRLHCDSAKGESGFATFAADRAGSHGGVKGPSVDVLARVAVMGPAFHRAAIESLKGFLGDRHFRPDRLAKVGSQYGALIGSIHARMPSILVEMCVLDNPRDERAVDSKAGRSRLVQAMVRGVEAAFQAEQKPRSSQK